VDFKIIFVSFLNITFNNFSLVNEVYELQSQLARLNTKLDDAEVAKVRFNIFLS